MQDETEKIERKSEETLKMKSKKEIWARDRKHKDKKRMNARDMTNTYFKRGLIKKVMCENCGSKENLQFHHPDYNLWRVVIVLCRNCHVKLHNQLKSESGR